MATHSSIQYSWKFHEQKSLAGYTPLGCKELDTTELLTLSLLSFTSTVKGTGALIFQRQDTLAIAGLLLSALALLGLRYHGSHLSVNHDSDILLWFLSGLLLLFSHSVVSFSLRPHEPQYARFARHSLLEFAQTHVHWVVDATQSSHPL